jgi:hypothetical protein
MQSISFAGKDNLSPSDHADRAKRKLDAQQHLSSLLIPASTAEEPRLKIQGAPDEDTFEPGEKSLPHTPSFEVTDHSLEDNGKRKHEEVDLEKKVRRPSIVLHTPVGEEDEEEGFIEKGLLKKELDPDSNEALSPGRAWEDVEQKAVRGGDTKYLWQKGSDKLHSPHEDKSDPENIEDIVAKRRRTIPEKWTDLLKALKADQENKEKREDSES